MSFHSYSIALLVLATLWSAGCAVDLRPEEEIRTLFFEGDTLFVASLDDVERQQESFAAPPATKDASSIGEVTIDLKIAQPKSSKYRRPYVAIWIEDGGGKVVRFLTVWGPQVKYQRDLRAFWQVSKQAEEKDIDAVTRATRPPGEYKVIWDGLDNAGKTLPTGDYTILLDVAREHGTRVSMKKAIACKAVEATEKIAGNAEIESVALKYAPVKK